MDIVSHQKVMCPVNRLHNGLELPLIGLGTWKLKDDFCTEIVRNALEIGYRHIDTATGYENHTAIGRALETVNREDIFITTKINLSNVNSNPCIASIVKEICSDLHSSYIDLILLHTPAVPFSVIKDLQNLLADGIVRAIGVSNFNLIQLRMVNEMFPGVICVNQIELHAPIPLDFYAGYFKNDEEKNQYFAMVSEHQQMETYCRTHKIALVAHRPLAKGLLIHHAVLEAIGAKYNKSAAQIALRWLVQQGFHAIPRGESVQQLKENIDIFDFVLSMQEMQTIANIT